jgi:Fungal chitosanase of glycosyl hydrolase group 75
MKISIHKKNCAILAITIAVNFFASSSQAATCKLIKKYEGTVNVFQTNDGLITYNTNVDVNTDGALSSYKADDLGYFKPDKRGVFTDTALNTICNGVNIRNNKNDLVYNYTKCGKLIAEFKRIRNFGWIKEGENYVDFYAIARNSLAPSGINRGKPCEKDGYYVSMTAKPMQSSKPVCDPEHWVDSLRIPAIVMPLDKAMKKAGVKLFDIAIIRPVGSQNWVGAIVGDTNPTKIGEGTVNLNRNLKGLTSNPKNYQSALGYVVGKAEFIVFPGSSIRLGEITNDDDSKIQNLAVKLAEEFDIETRSALCP